MPAPEPATMPVLLLLMASLAVMTAAEAPRRKPPLQRLGVRHLAVQVGQAQAPRPLPPQLHKRGRQVGGVHRGGGQRACQRGGGLARSARHIQHLQW